MRETAKLAADFLKRLKEKADHGVMARLEEHYSSNSKCRDTQFRLWTKLENSLEDDRAEN